MLAATLSLLANTGLRAKDDNGHTLVRLWREYYSASDSDKPQDALDALATILDEAGRQRLAWDFWDAARLKKEWATRQDWKVRRQAEQDRYDSVEAFGEPVAVYFNRNGKDASELRRYAFEHKDRLCLTFNPEFYADGTHVSALSYSEALIPELHCDWEFVLWDLFLRGQKDTGIEEYFADSYPVGALVEYSKIASDDYDAYRDYVIKYNTRAVSLLARERLLDKEFSDLCASGADSRQFLALSAECDKFIADRKILCGKAEEKAVASCCTGPDNILETLTAKAIGLNMKDGLAEITLRNLQNVRVKVIQDGRTFFDTTLDNPARSFYVPDTLRLKLPALPDGDYTLQCSSDKVSEDFEMFKYTLSLSSRSVASGTGVYVADYMTGEPVRDYTVELLDGSGKVLATADIKGASGFAELPPEMVSKAESSRRTCSLRAVVKDKDGNVRRSGESYRSGFRARKPVSGGEDDVQAEILTDRSAFNPDETVFFKAILYTGRYAFKTIPEGSEVTVTLEDPQGNELSRQTLAAGEYGSVDGSFTLARSERGGLYAIKIYSAGSLLATRRVRVDDFVLPTFDVAFEDAVRLYLEEDSITVQGRVQAYSGHSLGSASATYEVSCWGDRISGGDLALEADGSFSIGFKAPQGQRSISVTVKIADGTGETLEFQTSRHSAAGLGGTLTLDNAATGTCSGGVRGCSILDSGVAVLKFACSHYYGPDLPYPGLAVNYKVSDSSGKVICETASDPDYGLVLPMSSFPSGMYTVEAVARAVSDSGREYVDTQTLGILKCPDSDTSLDADILCMFRDVASDPLAVQIGAARGDLWVVAEIYDSAAGLLDARLVHLGGKRAAPGSLFTLKFTRKASWSGDLTIKLLTFRDGEVYTYTRTAEAPGTAEVMPLEFTRVLDTTRPGTGYTFSFRTAPGAECAVTVFDKSTEAVQPSVWTAPKPRKSPSSSVSFSTLCGRYLCRGADLWPVRVIGYGAAKSSARLMATNAAPDTDEAAVEESAFLPTGPAEVTVRENFANTLAWEPCLRTDAEGNVTFDFTTSDKLSTYYVQVFAHDKAMNAAADRREFKVTIPVKVSLVQPQYLYGGDLYAVSLTVSNNLDTDVPGRVAVRCYDGADYENSQVIGLSQGALTVRAGGSSSFAGYVRVSEKVSEMGILVQFKADNPAFGGDAVFVTVPVSRPVQSLKESHSALLLSGRDAAALADSLRTLFVNVPGSDAVQSEISIRRMLGEALPGEVVPDSDNCLALSKALYAARLLKGLGAGDADDDPEVLGKLLACRNDDGGFAWFEGMSSSPVLTALLLQRFAAMPGLVDDEITRAAVLWLDKMYFTQRERPLWCGGLSLQTYLHTRSLYTGVPFDVSGFDSKVVKQFRKDAKAYLVPSKASDLQGQILAKARRISLCRTLTGSPEGLSLAGAWGLGSNPARKLSKTQRADYESLLQYARPHSSGGWYYPNAVMPFRGLMESELYAHSLLCDLLADIAATDPSQARASQIADGIRLWMMVQKETQQWGDDPAYIEALSSVFHGSGALLDTKVLVLSAGYEKPFKDIKAAGNGFIVSCEYVHDGKVLEEGDVLHVGDKITAQYKIWNGENRSFVRLTVPRPACLRPVEQLSGRYGWRFSPLNVAGWYSVTPQGYRSVLSDRTQYWFDSYPEEDTVVSEDLFVTQEGSFSSPVAVVESLYAPHYRANDSGRAAVRVEP